MLEAVSRVRGRRRSSADGAKADQRIPDDEPHEVDPIVSSHSPQDGANGRKDGVEQKRPETMLWFADSIVSLGTPKGKLVREPSRPYGRKIAGDKRAHVYDTDDGKFLPPWRPVQGIIWVGTWLRMENRAIVVASINQKQGTKNIGVLCMLRCGSHGEDFLWTYEMKVR